MVIRTPQGQILSEDEWARRAHEVVFDVLERELEGVDFPKGKEELLEAVGDAPVVGEPAVPLRPYLETLPDREYAYEDDVAEALNRTWNRADLSRFGMGGGPR